MKFRFLIFFLTFTALPKTACAAEVIEFFNGARALGMGGALISEANDETALLANPAGLGKLRDYFVTVFDPEIEGGANAVSLAGSNPFAMFKPQPVLDKLVQPANLGKRLDLRAQAFPSLVVPNFGIGVFGRYSVNAKVDATATNYELRYLNDLALVAGFNFRLFDGIVKLGASARAVNRVQIDRTDIPANSTGLTVDSLGSEGFGVGSDVGLILTAPVATLPTVAAVWRDVGGTNYQLKSGMMTSAITIPDHTQQTVDVALAFHPIVSKRSRFSFTTEYRDVLTASEETDQYRRAHVGLEWNFADAFFIRAGMNQRYWTAGLEVAMLNYQLQFATYGEEVGTATTTEEDRRYVFKFAFRF